MSGLLCAAEPHGQHEQQNARHYAGDEQAIHIDACRYRVKNQRKTWRKENAESPGTGHQAESIALGVSRLTEDRQQQTTERQNGHA